MKKKQDDEVLSVEQGEAIYKCLTQFLDLAHHVLFTSNETENDRFRQITSLMLDTGMNKNSMSIQMTYSHFSDNVKRNSYSVMYTLSNLSHFIDTYQAFIVENNLVKFFNFINEPNHVAILRKNLPEDLCLSADEKMFTQSQTHLMKEKILICHEKYMIEKNLHTPNATHLIEKEKTKNNFKL
jgi:hypothetical protein